MTFLEFTLEDGNTIVLNVEYISSMRRHDSRDDLCIITCYTDSSGLDAQYTIQSTYKALKKLLRKTSLRGLY